MDKIVLSHNDVLEILPDRDKNAHKGDLEKYCFFVGVGDIQALQLFRLWVHCVQVQVWFI